MVGKYSFEKGPKEQAHYKLRFRSLFFPDACAETGHPQDAIQNLKLIRYLGNKGEQSQKNFVTCRCCCCSLRMHTCDTLCHLRSACMLQRPRPMIWEDGSVSFLNATRPVGERHCFSHACCIVTVTDVSRMSSFWLR